MRSLYKLLISILFISTFGFATVTVDGYAYLENLSDHSGITVTFERTAPSALTETATTDASGYFTAQLEGGVYDVTFIKDDYFSESLTDQSLYANTTLSDITLIEYTTLISVPSLFSTIQSGIDHAIDGDTVLVAAGTYNENINYNGKNIVVGSLYLTTGNPSYISSTIIDGQSSGSVVLFVGGENSTAVLTGFTITNGLHDSGGGINCTSSSPSLLNLIISGNTSSNQGGGIYCLWGGPTLNNVTIENNSAVAWGGGLWFYSASPVIKNTIVSDNTGDYGVYMVSGNPTIIYSNFYNNEGGNFKNPYDWLGINITTNVNGDSCDAFYNIQEDPLFVDSDNGDYNLQQGSPCIDAGDPTSTYDADGSIADMGAFPSAYGTPVPIVRNVPTDYSTIQAGLTAAGTNDTVLVQPGTYTENIIWPETNRIKLISAGDSSNTIIDGGGVSSVIYMNPQTATIDTTTLIQGFKITNGGNTNITSGGGMIIVNAGVNIVECNITNNLSNEKGGGIFFENSNSNIYHSNINNNQSGFNEAYRNGGGGIYSAYSTLSLFEVSMNDNICVGGGGAIGGGMVISDEIYMGGSGVSNITITNSSISNNDASSTGGIFIQNSNVIFTNVNIDQNLSTGLYLHSSDIEFHGVNVSNNGGGGIYSHGTDIIGNLNIFNNAGGGIVSAGQDVEIKNVKIFGNTTTYTYQSSAIRDGGMYDYGIIVDSCIISGNISTTGNTIYSSSGKSFDITNSIIINNSAKYAGILSSNGTVNINYSTLFNNTSQDNYDGILMTSGGSLTISNSNIYNEGNSLQNNEILSFSIATNNYWGHSSGPYHPSQNPSGQGDSVNVYVNVDPWLTTPNTDAPPIPAQNTTVTGTGNDFISLKWDTSPIGDLAGYKLYYDSDSSGYPYTNSVDIGTDTSHTLSSLTLGTTYYLAVTTYDTDGNESWYSNEVTGTTRVMQAQSLDIGGDEDLQRMVNHTPSITFNYYDSMNETQTSYQIQVSTQSDYSSADMWDSGEVTSSDTSVAYAGTTLADGATYYLRAKVGAGSFYSNWSTLTFRMNTEPTTPVLVSPINDQVTATPVVLNVFNATDAESDVITYSFNVYGDATLTTKLDSATTVTEGTDTTSWQVTATLPDNGQYFWTVSTNDGYEESTVSTAASFLLNISNDAPAAFALLSPTDSAEVTTLTPLLDWASASDPDPIDTVRYTLYYGTAIPDLQMVSVDTATSYQVPTSLSDNTTYYWKAVANDLNEASTENIGGYHNFRVNTANDLPGDFALISPEDESIVTDLTPTLYWEVPVDPDDRSRSIVSYHVYLDTSFIYLDTSSTTNHSLYFDGSDDYINISSVTNVSTQMSFIAWAKLTSSSSTYRYILNSGNWSTGRVYTGFQNSSSYVVDVYGVAPFDAGNVALAYSLNMSDHLNAWHLYGFTIDTPSKTIVLYIDGVAVKERTLTTFPTSLNLNAYIGDWFNGSASRGWIGNIDEVAIWDESLTAAEITALYNSGSGLDALSNSGNYTSSSNLQGYWKFNEGTGNTVTDQTSNNNDGTINGAIWDDDVPTPTTSSPSTVLDIVTTNSYTASNLLEDVMYYWKIVAVDDDSGTTESSTWSFLMNNENSVPSSFTLLTPTVDEETGLTPTFSWTASNDADLYDMIGYTLSYGSDPTSLTDVSTNGDLTYTPATALMDNTVYVWQVTATDQSGATYTTELQFFTVNSANDDPGVFSLISPDSGSVVLELPPLLVWSPTTDLDGDSVLFDIQLNGTSIGMTHHNYYFVDGLAEGMTYTWSVTATDNNGGSTQSGTWSFIVNTENVPPTPFTLLSPEAETVLSTQSVFFEWEISTDPDPMDSVTYGLDVHTDTTHMHFEINTTSFTSETFMDNRVYNWSVTAHDMNGGVTENIGGPRMFVINVENDPPTASTLVAPLNESIQTDLTPNFYWTESLDPDPMDHISYTMHWWPMGVLPVIYSTDTDSNSFTPEENLTDNSQFGWMVTANDMHGAQSNSDSSYFYTDAFPEPPLNFVTITPENNAEGIATEVAFVWNETDDPDPVEVIHYQLVYATDWQDSSTYVYSNLLEDTSLTLTLEDNSQYYWIVVAMDTDGFMVGSNDNMPNTMVVGTLSIDGADIPEVFALHQNYPNPFNPTTTLKYDLPEDALVNITIYDMMGRVVKTMVNSQQNAGFKSVRWNATNDNDSPVSAGLYLYTIQAGEFRQTKKMVLLK